MNLVDTLLRAGSHGYSHEFLEQIDELGVHVAFGRQAESTDRQSAKNIAPPENRLAFRNSFANGSDSAVVSVST